MRTLTKGKLVFYLISLGMATIAVANVEQDPLVSTAALIGAALFAVNGYLLP